LLTLRYLGPAPAFRDWFQVDVASEFAELYERLSKYYVGVDLHARPSRVKWLNQSREALRLGRGGFAPDMMELNEAGHGKLGVGGWTEELAAALDALISKWEWKVDGHL
jgi:hypothetical protein